MLRKIAAISIFSVLLFGTVGYYMLFKAAQFAARSAIKERIKAAVPEKDLFILKVVPENKHRIDWEEEDKEFRYKGKMYDVVRVENKSDTLLYYCIRDDKESQLFAGLNDLVRQQSSGEGRLGKLAKGLLKVFFCVGYLPDIPAYIVSVHVAEQEMGCYWRAAYNTGFY